MSDTVQQQVHFCSQIIGTNPHLVFRAPPNGQRVYIDFFIVANADATDTVVILQEGKVNNNVPVLAAPAPGHSGSSGNIRTSLPLNVEQELYVRLTVGAPNVWVTVVGHYAR